jgi:putative protease
MFIDNPRDNSFKHANDKSNAISVVQIQEAQQTLSSEKDAIVQLVAEKINHLSIAKPTLSLAFSGKVAQPLSIAVSTPEQHFVINSTLTLTKATESRVDEAAIEKRFKSLKSSGYQLQAFNFDGLDADLSLPFSQLTQLKNELLLQLTQREYIGAVTLPKLPKHPKVTETPTLSLLISDEKDVNLCDVTQADIYFKLPESFKKNDNKYIDIFLRNPRLIPWFPAVLIGKDYIEAVRVLEVVKPKRIVTNNTGVAFKAYEMGIEWIAGPFLNTTNSYALLTLQEQLNCAGAFISNEINRNQIKNIARPENFKLLYSIYHPILMMTSRQCFFQQTVGCNKPSIEDGCMLKCEKATTITNVKGISFAVDKQKGGYPSIYNHEQFLNIEAVEDLSYLFDEFFIDLTNIGSGSKAEIDKVQLVNHFENVLKGVTQAKIELNQLVTIATNAQYQQGL